MTKLVKNMATLVNSKINKHSFTRMVIFDAVVQDVYVCLTEHLVVEFLGDDVWEYLLAVAMDTSSLTTREFAQSGFSGCVPVSCTP